MSENQRDQFKTNLLSRDVEKQVSQILDRVENHLNHNELTQALSECEAALQLSPDSALIYNYLGEIYDGMEQLDLALANYQKAIQLDGEYQDAWDNMLSVEAELEAAFQDSIARQHLDHALEFALNDEPEKAMAECETAKPLLPGLALAYNHLGLIYHTLDHLEPAIDSYLQAIQLNPRFYAARENLADARERWEEEQFSNFPEISPTQEPETSVELDESEAQESEEPAPQWLFMDKSAFLLPGRAGHRTRYGRSGFDPLETEFEFARMQGVVIRLLFTRKFRTRNPIYLLLMAFVGVLFFSVVLLFTLGDGFGIIAGLLYSPYWIFGALLLVNVFLSLQLEESDESEENGSAFF